MSKITVRYDSESHDPQGQFLNLKGEIKMKNNRKDVEIGNDGMILSELKIDASLPVYTRFVLSVYLNSFNTHQSISLTTEEAQALARHLNSIVGSE